MKYDCNETCLRMLYFYYCGSFSIPLGLIFLIVQIETMGHILLPFYTHLSFVQSPTEMISSVCVFQGYAWIPPKPSRKQTAAAVNIHTLMSSPGEQYLLATPAVCLNPHGKIRGPPLKNSQGPTQQQQQHNPSCLNISPKPHLGGGT